MVETTDLTAFCLQQVADLLADEKYKLVKSQQSFDKRVSKDEVVGLHVGLSARFGTVRILPSVHIRIDPVEKVYDTYSRECLGCKPRRRATLGAMLGELVGNNCLILEVESFDTCRKVVSNLVDMFLDAGEMFIYEYGSTKARYSWLVNGNGRDWAARSEQTNVGHLCRAAILCGTSPEECALDCSLLQHEVTRLGGDQRVEYMRFFDWFSSRV